MLEPACIKASESIINLIRQIQSGMRVYASAMLQMLYIEAYRILILWQLS